MHRSAHFANDLFVLYGDTAASGAPAVQLHASIEHDALKVEFTGLG
jgi:hypothetical protein